MKKICFLVIGVFFVFTGISGAHPPTDIQLAYDRPLQSLHIEMTHVSHNLKKHRIRLITVFVNGKEVDSLTLTTQSSPHKVVADLLIKADVGSTISIKAVCSEGGIGAASLTVSRPQGRSQSQNNSFPPR